MSMLDLICKEVGLRGGQRDTLNAALGVLSDYGLTAQIWIEGKRTAGRALVGAGGFASEGAVTETVRSTDRGIAAGGVERGLAYMIAVSESRFAQFDVVGPQPPVDTAIVAAAGDAQAGYDEKLDCNCPVHRAERGGGL